MEGKGDDVLVNDGRNEKYDQRGNNSITTTKKLVNVFIDVSVQPIMDDNVPGTIICGIWCRIPPILNGNQCEVKTVMRQMRVRFYFKRTW